VGITGFERRLESMVEGVFARAFRSALRPVELGRKLVRVMDDQRSVDVRGRTVVPNHFTISLSDEDHERFAEMAATLRRELCDAAREHARDEHYSFVGPVVVELVVGDRIRTGSFGIVGMLREGEGGVGAGSLVFTSGHRIPLGDRTISVGRLPECDVALSDANVSRKHAEIRPSGDGWVVADLGSTNGTRVNGVRISEQRLRAGDSITFGATTATFEES
jgi:hypothetical protein